MGATGKIRKRAVNRHEAEALDAARHRLDFSNTDAA
jgi:hypothetical protein